MNEIIEEEKKRGRGRPKMDIARRNQVKTMMNDEEVNRLRDISQRSGLTQSDIMRIGAGMFIKQLENLYPNSGILGGNGEALDAFEAGMYDDFELDGEEN